MKAGKMAPFELQIAFNILVILMGVKIYDSFLKNNIGKGRSIDELLGLK